MKTAHKLTAPKNDFKREEKTIVEQCDLRHCGQRLVRKEFCDKYKIPIKDVVFCDKIFKGGWISPDGKFTYSDFGSHDVDAEEIVEEQFPVIFNRLQEEWLKKKNKNRFLNEYCKDKLIEKGWVDLTGNPWPMMGFTTDIYAICISEEKVTPQQHEIIKTFIDKGMSFSGFVKINFRT